MNRIMCMWNEMTKSLNSGWPPVRLQSSGGFNWKEINRIQKIVISHQTQIMECWNEYFIG